MRHIFVLNIQFTAMMFRRPATEEITPPSHTDPFSVRTPVRTIEDINVWTTPRKY
jgi:hypothetical protein